MSAGILFRPWPKTPRLFRDVTITEKIDGTNAAIGIVPADELDTVAVVSGSGDVLRQTFDEPFLLDVWDGYAVYAQSRNRLITPGKTTDNYGFAAWVQQNAGALVEILGEGLHFGEWWGSKIARGYGLTGDDKRFSLFDRRYLSDINDTAEAGLAVPGLDVVPLLYEGLFTTGAVEDAMEYLRTAGSVAQPGFMRPEGVVIYHSAARQGFKALLEGDDLPKSLAEASAA